MSSLEGRSHARLTHATRSLPEDCELLWRARQVRTLVFFFVGGGWRRCCAEARIAHTLQPRMSRTTMEARETIGDYVRLGSPKSAHRVR